MRELSESLSNTLDVLSLRASAMQRDNKGRFVKGQGIWQGLKMPPEIVEKSNGWKRGLHLSPTTEFKKGVVPWNKALTQNDIRVQKYCFNEGNFRKGEHTSPETEFKKGYTPWNKGKPYLRFRGKNHPRWKGGHIPYYGPDWFSQKHLALKRDDNTCQICGKRGEDKNLDVHHLVPFRHYGLKNHHEANQLSNLITLCMMCHRMVENGNN